jgi:hypothetical protein
LITFNELLLAHGVDPAQVALLRHTGQKGRLGITPYELWMRDRAKFDLYQRTQEMGKAVFRRPYWASFVGKPQNETLFVGLYSSVLAEFAHIDWNCPISGMPPGKEKGRKSDLYILDLMENMADYYGQLKIDWGLGWVKWDRYADRNNFVVLDDIQIDQLRKFEGSTEGQLSWIEQRKLERDSNLARKSLFKNAAANRGEYVCEACSFKHADRSMFDAHHLRPIFGGERLTQVSDLIVLCPTCHRRAHRSENRLQPYSLTELRSWNVAGRP